MLVEEGTIILRIQTSQRKKQLTECVITFTAFSVTIVCIMVANSLKLLQLNKHQWNPHEPRTFLYL